MEKGVDARLCIKLRLSVFWPEKGRELERGRKPTGRRVKGKEGKQKPTKSLYQLIESAALEVDKRPGGLAVEIVSWLRSPVT